jgi:xanthine dehydrogenase large subunit
MTAPLDPAKVTSPLKHVRKSLAHDSAEMHVTGSAPYIDDLVEAVGTLHVVPGYARQAVRGKISSIDLTDVSASEGVVAVLTADNVPGTNDCSSGFGDDPVLAESEILFHGQVVFAVVAETRDQARKAALKARIDVAPITPVLTQEDAVAAETMVLPDYQFRRGSPETGLTASEEVLSGSMRIGGQEHFYLEGQIAMAVPQEGGAMLVHTSTQHPTEVQHTVAKVLGVPDALVTAEVRRMGGGFGGKESQANQWASLAALGARATGRACKVRLDRDDDMISGSTGKSAMTAPAKSGRSTWNFWPAAAIRSICPLASTTGHCFMLIPAISIQMPPSVPGG